MQTRFALARLADAPIRDAEQILRKCVHCGFCTATCPTYVLSGNELDSPRGRIYLIKEMLESDRPSTPEVVTHLDRCLSCLSCMTTCPSGVQYVHLVDHARTHVEETYRRSLLARLQRFGLLLLLTSPKLLRLAVRAANLLRRVPRLLPARLRAMLALAPATLPPPSRLDRPQVFPAVGPRRKRVAMLAGCAQRALDPSINDATIRLLTRHGVEVVIAHTACCGALAYHLGKAEAARRSALENIVAWSFELESEGLDAIVVNASGCGTVVKDYSHLFKDDPRWAERAARVSRLARDVTEVLYELGLAEPRVATGQVVAYHSACSMQHGQRIKAPPRELLARAGFVVREIPEGHLCCGSAGTYSLLQPELATQLRDRKLRAVESVEPDAVATGNMGCMKQLASATRIPIVHTVQLLDWATGGPIPDAIATHPRFTGPAGQERNAVGAQA